MYDECRCERCADEGHYYGGSDDPAECGPSESRAGRLLCRACRDEAPAYGDEWGAVNMTLLPDSITGPRLRLTLNAHHYPSKSVWLDAESCRAAGLALLEHARALDALARELAS